MTMTVKNFNQTAEAKGFTTSVDATLSLILLKQHETAVWAIAMPMSLSFSSREERYDARSYKE